MRIRLPCWHTGNLQRYSRGSMPLLPSRSTSILLVARSPSIINNGVIEPPRRQLFSLPGLSDFSPFGSNSPNPKGKEDCDVYHEKVTLPYSKDLLFKIVSNVNDYQSFVPYCVQSRVDESSRKQIDAGKNEFLADLAIGYGQFQESYTSKVTIIEGKSVQATAIPTPLFKRLETIWSFSNHTSHSTEVDFQIYYAFANPLYAAFAKTAIEKMTSRMIEAFKGRAEEIQNKDK